MYEERILKVFREFEDLKGKVLRNEKYIRHLILTQKNFEKIPEVEKELKNLNDEIKKHRMFLDILDQKITKIQEKLDEIKKDTPDTKKE